MQASTVGFIHPRASPGYSAFGHIEKLIPYINSYNKGEDLLKEPSLSPQNRERIVNKIFSYIQNSDQSRDFLWSHGKYLLDGTVMKVLKKAVLKFSYVSSAAQFIERSESFLPKKYISEIVKDSLPSFENTEEVVNFLKRTGVHLSKPDREMLMEKALDFVNSEKELKAFKNVLPDSEYQAALKQFQNASKRVGGRMTERLKCLRRQLQLAIP